MNKILIKYQDNFADNITSYAYAKIIEEHSGYECCYENSTKERSCFEEKMQCFNLDYNYVSSLRIEKISKNALEFNDNYIYKGSKKYKTIKRKFFNPEDAIFLNEKIKSEITFKNLDFIKEHDILEEITTNNSIGIYINSKDFKNNQVNFQYIENALKRLNKYIKKPTLYIFTSESKIEGFNTIFNYKILNIADWKEEFHFLTKCKHKIIINSPNSYSINFWAALLNEKSYHYAIFEKKSKNKDIKIKKKNWIYV